MDGSKNNGSKTLWTKWDDLGGTIIFGNTQIIHLFIGFFPYKPSILGYHYFWKHPLEPWFLSFFAVSYCCGPLFFCLKSPSPFERKLYFWWVVLLAYWRRRSSNSLVPKELQGIQEGPEEMTEVGGEVAESSNWRMVEKRLESIRFHAHVSLWERLGPMTKGCFKTYVDLSWLSKHTFE